MAMLLVAVILIASVCIIGSLSGRIGNPAFSAEQNSEIRRHRNKATIIGVVGVILVTTNAYLWNNLLPRTNNDEFQALILILVFVIFFDLFLMLREWIAAPSENYVKTKQRLDQMNAELNAFLSKYHVDKRFLINSTNRTEIAICKQEKQLLIYNRVGFQKALSFSKIVNCEILEDNVTVLEGGIGRAVVGAFIAGGTGAIVGAATRNSSNKVNSMCIRIITDDILDPYYSVQIVNTPLERNSEEYKEKFQLAQKFTQQ